MSHAGFYSDLSSIDNVNDALNQAELAKDDAEAAALAASGSQVAAANSASSATTSASNASNSANAAQTSATNAAASEAGALTNANNAATSASNAATSATNASNSATAAAGSASAAATSASNAASTAAAMEARLNSTIPFDLSWIAEYDNKSIVITGDSLSYNRYDFDATNRDNAYDCFPGMMSWSFMLRDFFKRADPWFQHADQFDYLPLLGGQVVTANVAAAYVVPFNNRYVFVEGTGATSQVITMYKNQNEETERITMHFASNPNAEGDCKADVYYALGPTYASEVLAGTVDARAGGANFQGFAPFHFSFTAAGLGTNNYPVKILFKNFRLSNGNPIPSGNRGFFFQGFGSKRTNVHLTGRGSWTTADLLADFTARIGTHVPDLLFMIIGANDRLTRTKEQYAADLGSLIDSTLAVNANCKIVVMAPTPASTFGFGPDEVLNGSTMTEFLTAGRNVVVNKGCYWFDTYNLFRKIAASDWRFDTIHMTKNGNKYLFDSIINSYFGAAIGSKEWYFPRLQAGAGGDRFRDKDGLPMCHGTVNFQFSSGTSLYTETFRFDDDAVVVTANRTAADRIQIVLNYNALDRAALGRRFGTPRLELFGAQGIWAEARVYTFGNNSMEFILWNHSANAAITDATNNGLVWSFTF